MEEYNGCSVPQYTAYRRVSFSRKGVEGLQRVFPDNRVSGFQILEDNSNPGIERPFGLLRIDEQGGENHECFKHGSDVEDGLIVVLCGKDGC